MVKFSTRQLVFFYVTLTSIAFLWFYSSCGFQECREKEFEHLIQTYRVRNKELQHELDSTRKQLREFGPSLNSEQKQAISLSNSVIYIVTPTHTHPEQKANLVRLSHTLLHVKHIHWIIVEDSTQKTALVSDFLTNSRLSYTHLNVATPTEIKLKYNDPTWLKPKGVLQRNAALKWLRDNLDINKNHGVVYFADDDNTYSLEIFEQMRSTEKVSVWPVGLVGELRYEKPVVRNEKVEGWFTYWKPDRPFPMDMAGFAINLNLFLTYPDAKFTNEVPRGYQESIILQKLHIKMEDLEPLANDCTKVLVWHTRTEKTKLRNEEKMKKKYGHGSNLNIEV